MQEPAGTTLRDVLHVLFKWKHMIILFCAGTLVTGAAFIALTAHPTYEAAAKIVLRPGREHVSDPIVPPGGELRPSLRFNVDEETAGAIALLTSRYLSERVVEKLGARSLCREQFRFVGSLCDPKLDDTALLHRVAARMRENIHALRVGDSALISLSFSHEDPALALKFLNTLIGLYVERHLSVTKNPRVEAFLQEQLPVLKKKMLDAQAELESFKQLHGIASTVKDDRDIAVHELTNLTAERNDMLSRQAAALSRIAQLKPQLVANAKGTQTMWVSAEKMRDLQHKETEMSMRLGDNNPTLIEVRDQIQKIHQDLLTSQDASGFQRLQEELLQRESDLTAARARLGAVEPTIAELKKTIQNLDRTELDFHRLEEDSRSAQLNYNLYLTKSEESRISDEMDAEKIASVTVVDPADMPLAPLPSTAPLRLALTAIFGLAGALVLAFFREALASPLDTTDRAQAALGVPVLVSIPDLRQSIANTWPG
jgi:uncharacterized protein involved in exopolysaccharide biosynthesis